MLQTQKLFSGYFYGDGKRLGLVYYRGTLKTGKEEKKEPLKAEA